MPKNIFELKTVQGSAFKGLCEAKKEILTEANFECDKTGIRVVQMDSTHTVLVHLKLEADSFESYICEDKLVLGVSMINLFKLVKTIGNSDILVLYVEENNKCVLGIRIENSDKHSVTNFKLHLLDLNDNTFNIPPTVFPNILTMPSIDFQKLCRDMQQLTELVEIKSLDQQLVFSGKGDFADQETVLHETAGGVSYLKNEEPSNIIQGKFSLKHLVLFTKCTPLCQSIKIYLKNDYPIIIEYSVASLGTIKLCLAPKIEENNVPPM